MEQFASEPRHMTYDETIKHLELKDHVALAKLAIPDINGTDNVKICFPELPMADMKKPDYVAEIKHKSEHFILHMEFESAYRDNNSMQKRMLRYFTYLDWFYDLPIYQVIVLLKESTLKEISNGRYFEVLGDKVFSHKYKIIEMYNIDKYEILSTGEQALYPLRVFMKYDEASVVEHIKECLAVVESSEDPDYYFLTVECGRKLFGNEILENFMKEAIYMSSNLFKHPYERGLEEGIEKGIGEGIEKGVERGKSEVTIRLLTKKFGILPNDMVESIKHSNMYKIDTILDNMLDFESLDDVNEYLK